MTTATADPCSTSALCLVALSQVPALDSILCKLNDLKAAMERARMDAIMAGGGGFGGGAGGDSVAAPLEALFRDHVRAAMSASTHYLLDMDAAREAAVRDATHRYDAIKARGSEGEVAAAAAVRDEAVRQAQTAFARDRELLLDDVRRHLAAAPSLDLLPAVVSVSILSLPLRLDVRLRPLDTIDSAVVAAVRSQARDQLKCDVVTFPPAVRWQYGAAGGEAITLDPTTPLFRQLPTGRPRHGSLLSCVGDVSAVSAAATRCVVDTWSPGTKADYMWCRTCGLKWVCRACAERCHATAAGHDCVPFLLGHTPTFAACYCRTRSGKCAIPHTTMHATTASGGAGTAAGGGVGGTTADLLLAGVSGLSATLPPPVAFRTD